MADNRIYLKCSICGGILFLGKSFYHGLHYANYDGIDLEHKLNEFYEEHIHLGVNDCNLLGTNFYICNERFTEERNEQICNLYD